MGDRKKLIEDARAALSVAVTDRAKLNVIISLLLAVVEALPKPLTFTDVPSDGDDGPDVEKHVVLVHYADPNENAPLSLGIAFLNDYNMPRDAIIAPPGYEILIRKVGCEITVTRQPHR